MHPIASETGHAMCMAQFEELRKCHADHPLLKFIGYCTDIRYVLDDCLNAEYKVLQSENARKAAISNARWLEKKQQLFPKPQPQQDQQSQ